MTLPTIKSGSPSQYLLWTACAIGMCITVTWTLVSSHTHDKYINNDRFRQYIDEQREWRNENRRQLDNVQDLLIKILKQRREEKRG